MNVVIKNPVKGVTFYGLVNGIEHGVCVVSSIKLIFMRSVSRRFMDMEQFKIDMEMWRLDLIKFKRILLKCGVLDSNYQRETDRESDEKSSCVHRWAGN